MTKELIQKAKNEVEDHLEMEQHHPYTQDDALIREIAKSRYSNLRNDLEWNLKLRQKEDVVYDREALLAILDRVFNKHQAGFSSSSWGDPQQAENIGGGGGGGGSNAGHGSSANVTMYMAEEMEFILSSYGKMATRRIMDRMPMICWQTCRTLKRNLQDMLLGGVTDSALETKYFADSPAVLEKHVQVLEQFAEVSEAVELVEQMLSSEVL